MEKEILSFIKKVRRRYMTQSIILYSITMGSIGLGAGTIINLMACFIPIYRSFFISALVSIIVTIGGILCYGVFHFPNKKKMALVIDKRGLEERLTTSLELMEQTDLLEQSKSSIKELQMKDTMKAIRTFPVKERFPFHFPKKPFWFFVFLLLLFSFAAIIPSPKKSEAMKRHEVTKEIKDKIKKVEKAFEQVGKMNKLDKTFEKQLKRMMQETKKELEKAESKEKAKKAMERLKTKVKQNLDDYRKRTKNQLSKSKSKEIKKILSNNNHSKKKSNISKEMLEEMRKALQKQMEKANNAEEKNALKSQLSQIESLEQLEDLEDLLESSIEYKKEQNSFKKSNGDKKDSEKGGTGEGNGNSKGVGKGKGFGKGAGNGMGGEKNTGSKKGIEMENTKEENPEKISVPGRKEGDDKNLKGKTNKGKSSNSKGGIGYGYKGEEVDYNQVIGDYMKNAYDKLDKNEVPAEMETVVKEYFEGIHQGE